MPPLLKLFCLAANDTTFDGPPDPSPASLAAARRIAPGTSSETEIRRFARAIESEHQQTEARERAEVTPLPAVPVSPVAASTTAPRRRASRRAA
jgi:hypothetical protein